MSHVLWKGMCPFLDVRGSKYFELQRIKVQKSLYNFQVIQLSGRARIQNRIYCQNLVSFCYTTLPLSRVSKGQDRSKPTLSIENVLGREERIEIVRVCTHECTYVKQRKKTGRQRQGHIDVNEREMKTRINFLDFQQFYSYRRGEILYFSMNLSHSSTEYEEKYQIRVRGNLILFQCMAIHHLQSIKYTLGKALN